MSYASYYLFYPSICRVVLPLFDIVSYEILIGLSQFYGWHLLRFYILYLPILTQPRLMVNMVN